MSVCLRKKNCQWISYEQVDRFEWKFRCMLQWASNRKPPLAWTVGPIFPNTMGRGVIFAILWTLISRKLLKISNNRGALVIVQFKDLQIWFWTYFRYLLRFWRYFEKKKLLLKKLSVARGFKNVLTRVEVRIKYLPLLGIDCKWWTAQSGQYFHKIWGGGVFWDFSDPCTSKTVGEIKMCRRRKLL